MRKPRRWPRSGAFRLGCRRSREAGGWYQGAVRWSLAAAAPVDKFFGKRINCGLGLHSGSLNQDRAEGFAQIQIQQTCHLIVCMRLRGSLHLRSDESHRALSGIKISFCHSFVRQPSQMIAPQALRRCIVESNCSGCRSRGHFAKKSAPALGRGTTLRNFRCDQ
jgi:hypothetical protein